MVDLQVGDTLHSAVRSGVTLHGALCRKDTLLLFIALEGMPCACKWVDLIVAQPWNWNCCVALVG